MNRFRRLCRSQVELAASAAPAFALALLLLGAPVTAFGVTFTVTKTADTADGVCDADCSLREAIIAANVAAGVDTVVVPAGTYVLTLVGAGEDAGATGDLDVTGDTIINGAGAATTIIDGNATDRVFHLHPLANAVTISGVTVRNGNVTGFGGGIHKDGNGAVIQVINAIVTGNTASQFGGGINNNQDSAFNVDFTTVSNNVAGAFGFGGGINNNSGGALTVRDSTVSGNSASGFGGGGINNNSIGTMLVVRSTISNNTSQNGGGINNNSTGQFTITDTLISGNAATGSIGGGGILNNFSGRLNLYTSTVSGNSSAGFGGGGINSNSSGQLDIQISTISGNATTGSAGGGGIYKNSTSPAALVSLTITGNASTNGGNSIHTNAGATPLSLFNTIVANPASGSNCGGAPVTSNGFNLASDASCNLIAAGDIQNANPLLAPLANNGGPTPTHGLQAGSPAIDTGSPASPSVDQRGVQRPVGLGFDIGAFEGTVGAALPTLSINSVAALEGNAGSSTLTFTVTLSAVSAQTVTVNYATADGTATAGSDYTTAAGVLTFLPGSTTQPIPISLLGDAAPETNETFTVTLSGAANATIAGATGTGTITNDDAVVGPPAPTAEIPTLSDWALLLLASLVAGFAAHRLRTRGRA